MTRAEFQNFSSENMAFMEGYLNLFEQNPYSIDSSWRHFFSGELIDTEQLLLYGHHEANFYPEGLYESRKSSFDSIYTENIGYEFWPYCSEEESVWLQNEIQKRHRMQLSTHEKIALLKKLTEAEVFETFLHMRYTGQKRFSLEGAETLIAMLAEISEQSKASDIIIGMPHRGRLNVLVNIVGKSYHEIFSEFEDAASFFDGSGDVKYHKGYVSEKKRSDGSSVCFWLPPNASHLESVDPIVEGIARSRKKSLPIIIHGDAAISGQGVVYETLQLAKLENYKTGGTIHIVINNHIGFTTLPEMSRSTQYPTDIAKTFSAPVFHVNAEDPESCIMIAKLALDYRNQFSKDVFIDLNCYRKYGHNESDEPAFTQPALYEKIRKKQSPRGMYHDLLVTSGIQLEKIDEHHRALLQEAFQEVKEKKQKVVIEPHRIKEHNALFSQYETQTKKDLLETFIHQLTTVPDGFSLHPRIEKQFQSIRNDVNTIDWALAEKLALASILNRGSAIRFSGQDSRRGTFSQRHGVLVDQKSEALFCPLCTISNNFSLIDSPLSEFGCLGFEYGYSLQNPTTLVIWEAQFGDFANGAQVIIDQYISSGEEKWGAKSRLTLLLPHGYEGQGPEHSSARIERFLSLAARDNMFIANPTTPSQYYHLLSRQALLQDPKPLIVFTPKALLRDSRCQSSLDDLSTNTFCEILEDPLHYDATRILFCQGKVFYDLQAIQDNTTAIIRIEQLYPFHQKKMEEVLSKYKNATRFFWVQEEPENMGAWTFIRDKLSRLLPQGKLLEYRGRAESASPACGSHRVHEQELQWVLESLLD